MINVKELQVGDVFAVDGYDEPLVLVGWRWSIYFEIESVSFLTIPEYRERLSKIKHHQPFTVDPKAGDPRAVQPIPLTKEWLERMGFNWEDNQLSYNDIRLTTRFFAIIPAQKGVEFTIDSPMGETKLLYVHQVQNWVFALSGEELNIEA